MEVFPAAVGLIIRALIISARWGGRARRLALEQATAASDANREATLEARVMVLEHMVEQRDAHIQVLESRLGEERSRKPYLLMERLRIIWLRQQEIELTRMEFDILAHLAQNADCVVTSKMIIGKVWGPEYAEVEDTQTLRVHISHLRKEIESHPSVPRYILTEPGVGFRFSTS